MDWSKPAHADALAMVMTPEDLESHPQARFPFSNPIRQDPARSPGALPLAGTDDDDTGLLERGNQREGRRRGCGHAHPSRARFPLALSHTGTLLATTKE